MQCASALFATFVPEQENLFATAIEGASLTVSAWIDSDSCVRFCLNFDVPRKIESALAEALALCAFLAFVAHQYVLGWALAVRQTVKTLFTVR
jgi:hypothetical protein